MKVFKKILISVVIAFTTLVIVPIMASNIGISGFEVQAASNVKLNKTKYTLNVGEKYKLKIKGTNKKVKWLSSNKKIASVNSNGKVTAKKKGNVTITAKVGNKKYKCEINVENPTLNKIKKTLNWGEGYTLKVKGTSQSVKWESSNKKVASVRNNGRVEAQSKSGSAIITATVGKTKLQCKIKVKPYSKDGIEITELTKLSNTVVIKLKNTTNFTVSISPTAKFYDKNGKKAGEGDRYNFAFEPNQECIMKIWNSTVKNSVRVYPKYKSVKINIGDVNFTKPAQDKYFDVKKLEIQSVKEEGDKYIAHVKNNSWFTFNFVNATMVYYDKNGKVIAAEPKDCHTNRFFAYGFYDFKFEKNPKDGDKVVEPASYKIFINYAYRYKN